MKQYFLYVFPLSFVAWSFATLSLMKGGADVSAYVLGFVCYFCFGIILIFVPHLITQRWARASAFLLPAYSFLYGSLAGAVALQLGFNAEIWVISGPVDLEPVSGVFTALVFAVTQTLERAWNERRIRVESRTTDISTKYIRT